MLVHKYEKAGEIKYPGPMGPGYLGSYECYLVAAVTTRTRRIRLVRLG